MDSLGRRPRLRPRYNTFPTSTSRIIRWRTTARISENARPWHAMPVERGEQSATRRSRPVVIVKTTGLIVATKKRQWNLPVGVSRVLRAQRDSTNMWNRIEQELNAVNKRLDQLIGLMLPEQPVSPDGGAAGPRTEYDAFTNQAYSPFDLPSKLLGNPSVMRTLGLDADFAQVLTREERIAGPEGMANAGARVLVVHHQHIVRCVEPMYAETSTNYRISALAAFSARVHTWYPILPSGFSQEYFRVLCGLLRPSSETCLSLLVAAIGHIVEQDEAASGTPYFETALASLPIIIAECSLRSVQCLMLIGLYYCCLLKPCQAHDYCLIASSKIQNIIKR